MRQCKYCKNEGKFEPSIRQVLCQKHRQLSLKKYLGRELEALTPEGVFVEEYLH